MIRWSELPDFKETEFTCRCCGVQKMDEDFLRTLQRIRTAFRHSMVISSGYRCPDHNNRVSSTGHDGPHTTGRAIDCKVVGGNALLLIDVALSFDMTGIGVKQHSDHGGRFIHLDNLDQSADRPRPWIWSYR